MFSAVLARAQGNRLSIQAEGPKGLSICGINDTANIQIYNISSGPVLNIQVKLLLPPGIYYVKNSVFGTGITESNVSNLNQPVFSAPALAVAKNFKMRVQLSSDCNLLSYLNSNNTPSLQVRADYLGNYDVGSSIPFSVGVPSAQFGTITNLSYTGDIGTKFPRSITIGNFGKGPLKELRLRRINGKDVRTFFVNSGTTTYRGDTVETIFNGSYFKNIGNKDTFLDQNETVTLIDSNIINNCKLLNTNFELLWGCGGKFCQVSRISGTALISNKTPNLKALPFPVNATCYTNNSNKSEIRFVNIGNMTAISPRVAISSNYYYMFSSMDTNSVRIKVGYNGTWSRPKKDSTYGTYNQGYYGCLGLNAIGFFRIKCPDLKPNDTLFVTWYINSCFPPACTNASVVINSWAYYADYRDQCKNLKTLNWTWGRVYDQHYTTASSFTPTDLINNQKGEFRTFFNSASLVYRSSTASYIVDLILPKGLTHSMQKNEFYFINSDLTTTWTPDSLVKKGDTLRAYFPHPVPINLTGAELVYYLKADCSKAGANGVQTIGLQMRYNPDKNCKPKEWLYLYCTSFQLKIHCYSNCGGGMKFSDFSVKRINFGKPDNDNDGKPDSSGTLDSAKVRKERCMVGDTILAQFYGVVKKSSSNITWRNAYIESTVTYGKYLDVAGVQLLVWRRGVTLSVNCNAIKYWKTVSGSNATFKFDLSTDSMLACVSSGFRYSNDDSLIVKVKFKVTGNIGGTTVNLLYSNRFYTSNVVNPTSNSNKFQCDTFSGQMIMAGYFFTTCCNDIYQINSCAVLSVNNYYYMGIGGPSYGGNNQFPYEYRHFARLKAIRYYVPSGYKLKNSYFTQYRTSGSNKVTLEIKDSLKAINNNATPLTFDVTKAYKDSAGPIFGSDDGFHGYYIAQLEPSCEILTGKNVQLKYDFIYEREGTLAPGYDTITSGFSDQIVYNKPVFTIKPVAPTIYSAQDTAEWEINFTNYSSTFSNINTWFSPDNSGAIKVVQIKDAVKDTLIPSTNQIYRVGTVNYNTTRSFKVRAIYNSCKKDSVVLYAGWNCSGFPKDLASYPCAKERFVLYLEPQNTQLQVSLSDSTTVADLCSGTPYTMTIENIGATTAYNTTAIINLPIGMTVVPGSCQIRYPHKSSKSSLSDPVLKSGTQFEWNLSNLNSTIRAGFKGVSDTNKNKIILYFRVKTSCDYSSGNYIRASAAANIKCGDPVLAYPAISNPLNIKGVTRPYYSLLKVLSDSIFPCEKPSKVKVKIINLGPSATGKEDKYQIVLPPGLSYDSTLFSAYYNSPIDSLTRKKNINGATEVEFSLKDSIQPGDSIYFALGFHADGNKVNCGSIDLYSQTAVKQEVTCVADNSKCKINVATGNSLIKPIVRKGDIVFSRASARITALSSDSETLVLSYRISNFGKNIESFNVIKTAFVYDKDASGTVNKVDEYMEFDTLHGPLKSGAYRDIVRTLKFKAGKSCALYLALDSSSCSCNFTYIKFPVPGISNAGPDRNICSADTFKAGSANVNGFRYQWSPSGQFNSDTVAQPWAVLYNNDSVARISTYYLTTYRGQCYSQDTVNVLVYTLPGVSIMQNDTTVCEGELIRLTSKNKGSNGGFTLQWTPAKDMQTPKAANTWYKPVSDAFVKLDMQDSKGCKAVDSIRIDVIDKPHAKFIYPPVCIGQLLNLYDSSYILSDSITYRKWTADFTDSFNVLSWQIDLNGNPDVNVRLITKSSAGCRDTFARLIEMKPYPSAAFTMKDVCFGDTVSLTNQSKMSKGNIIQNKWYFGDGDSSVTINPKHLYSTYDTFDVQLEVVSDFNCRDTAYGKVLIHEVPKSGFSFTDNCFGDSSVFNDQSSGTREAITAYQWNFDGQKSNVKDLRYKFSRDSAYDVSLKVNTAFGCADSISKTIQIRSLPVADFTVDTVCQGKSNHILSKSSIRKSYIPSYSYNLSDGSSYMDSSFYHQFAGGDTFDIQLIVASPFGCQDTMTKKAVVFEGVKPDFIFNPVCQADSASLINTSAFKRTNLKLIRYRFGDGDSASVGDVKHLYANSGTFKIDLLTETTEGCRYGTSKMIDVYPMPKADFSDSNKCFDNRFVFVNQSSVNTGIIAFNRWYFGDGDSMLSQDASHSYSGSGSYQLTLMAGTDKSCWDTVSRQVFAYPPVLVNFTNYPVCLGDQIEFKDSSVVPYATIKTYNWDFGDMTSSNLKDPWHKYAAAGNYPVKLQIITSYDCTYDTLKQSTVYPVPTAGFSTTPDQGTIVNPEISISDLSSGADTVFFDLGNGSTSGLRQLSALYPDSGTFLIRQIVSNGFGCRDSFEKRIVIQYMYVFNAPTSFTPNNDGTNDTYAPGGIGFSKYEMWIYNRWGEIIYHDDAGKAWDGTYGDSEVMQDVYAVRFKVKDYKGRYHYYSTTVTILR